MGAIGDPVQQGFAEPGIWKHLRPLGKCEFDGQDQRAALGAVGDDLEEKLGADHLGQRSAPDPVMKIRVFSRETPASTSMRRRNSTTFS